MWSWLIILLITLSCLFCFFSVVQLELKRPNAKIWIILTCFTIIAVVGTLFSVPSPILQKYSYEPKPAEIKLKELNAPEEQILATQTTKEQKSEETTTEEQTTEEQQAEQNKSQGEAIAENKTDDISQSTESTATRDSEEKKVLIMVPKLNVRSDSDDNAEILDTVQYGQILTEIEASEDSEWVKVRMDNGSTGWVAKRYLNDLKE